MTGRDDLFAVTLAPEEVKRAFRQIAGADRDTGHKGHVLHRPQGRDGDPG
jgi:hypothetical protein